MAGKVENKDLFGKDLFIKVQKDVEALVKELNILEETLVTVAKVQQQILAQEDNKTLKSIKRTKEAVDELNQAERVSATIRKEKAKLEDRLAAATSENIKDNTELKVLLQEQNKVNKELAKESLGLTNAYDKQSKRLIKLRKEFKGLLVEEGKSTKETKKLQKEIDKLDRELKEVDASAGQFQRNVGNYPETFANATKGLLGFVAAVGGAKLSLDGVKTSLEDTSEGSENVREFTAKASGAFDQFKNVVSGAALDLVDFGGALKTALTSGDPRRVLGVFQGKAAESGFDRTAKATENFGDKLSDSIDASAELEKRIIAFEKAVRPLEKRLAVLNGLIEQQQIIAGDSTRTFDEINNAILKGQELQIQRASINVKIAKEELDVSRERIRVANLAGGASVALLDQETEAVNSLIDAENALKNEILENEKEIRQVKQDRLERDLDILIDGFDNQKTINERIIANEKETLEARSALLVRTNELANKSFEEQKKILEDLSRAGIDVDELLSLDASELQKRIRQLEQSEIIEGRTLEVIRERRIVLLDLEEAQQALNEAEQEGLDLRSDILAQEKALLAQQSGVQEVSNKAIENLEKDRFTLQKESLERRIDLSKLGSLEELRLRKELNDLLLNEQQRLNEKESALREKSLQQQQELTKAFVEVISETLIKGFERNIEALGRQIEGTQERISQLREGAREGQLEAQESIAFEQKKEAELEKQRERERKRQEKAQAFFTVLSTFQGKVAAGDPNPLSSTIRDIAVLKGLASTLSAYDGVDDTGGRGNIDSKGGKLWTLHPNEQVWSKKDRGAVGFRSRDEIKEIVSMYDNGMMMDLLRHDKSQDMFSPNSFVLNGMGNGEMISKLDQLNKSIKSIDIPSGNVNIDEVRKLITLRTKKGNKITTEHSKLF